MKRRRFIVHRAWPFHTSIPMAMAEASPSSAFIARHHMQYARLPNELHQFAPQLHHPRRQLAHASTVALLYIKHGILPESAIYHFAQGGARKTRIENWEQLQKQLRMANQPQFDEKLVRAVAYMQMGAAEKLLDILYTRITGKKAQWQIMDREYSMEAASEADKKAAAQQQQPAFMRPTAAVLIRARMRKDDIISLGDNPIIEAKKSEEVLRKYEKRLKAERRAEPERYSFRPRSMSRALSPKRNAHSGDSRQKLRNQQYVTEVHEIDVKQNDQHLRTYKLKPFVDEEKTQPDFGQLHQHESDHRFLSSTPIGGGTNRRSMSLVNGAARFMPATSPLARSPQSTDMSTFKAIALLNTHLSQIAINSDTLTRLCRGSFLTLLKEIEKAPVDETCTALQHLQTSLRQVAELSLAESKEFDAVSSCVLNALEHLPVSNELYFELFSFLSLLGAEIVAQQPLAAFDLYRKYCLRDSKKLISNNAHFIRLAYSYVPCDPQAHILVLQVIKDSFNDMILVLRSYLSLIQVEKTLDGGLLEFYLYCVDWGMQQTDSSLKALGTALLPGIIERSGVKYAMSRMQQISAMATSDTWPEQTEAVHVLTAILSHVDVDEQTMTEALATLLAIFKTPSLSSVAMTGFLAYASTIIGVYPSVREFFFDSIQQDAELRRTLLYSADMRKDSDGNANTTDTVLVADPYDIHRPDIRLLWSPLVVVKCIADYVLANKLENLNDCLLDLLVSAIESVSVFEQRDAQQWIIVFTQLRDHLLAELCDAAHAPQVIDLLSTFLYEPTLTEAITTQLLMATSEDTTSALYGILRFLFPDGESAAQKIFLSFLEELSKQNNSPFQRLILAMLDDFAQFEPDAFERSEELRKASKQIANLA